MTIATNTATVSIAPEVTAGTAPAAGAFIRLTEVRASQPSLTVSKTPTPAALSQFAMPTQAVAANETATIEIAVPLYIARAVRASGSAALSPPPVDALLKSCGLSRTDSNSNRTATYAPAAAASGTCTIDWRAGSRRVLLIGCKGTCTLAATTTDQPVITFTMTGRISEAHQFTNTALPAVSGTAYRPIRGRGANVAFNQVNAAGVAAAAFATTDKIQTLNFDLASTVTRPASLTDSDGFALAQITARAPTFTAQVLQEPLTTGSDSFFTLLRNENLFKIAATLNSPDTGASFSFTLNTCQLTAAETEDSDGFLATSITGAGIELAGVAPFTLAFETPAP